MDYIDRFTKRGNALKAGYTDPDSRPHHRNGSNILIDVAADIALRAKIAGLDADELMTQAIRVADQEWYFAEPALREALAPKAAS